MVGLLSQNQYDYRDGTRTVHPPDDTYTAELGEHRGGDRGIIEESEDESLMEPATSVASPSTKAV